MSNVFPPLAELPADVRQVLARAGWYAAENELTGADLERVFNAGLAACHALKALPGAAAAAAASGADPAPKAGASA